MSDGVLLITDIDGVGRGVRQVLAGAAGAVGVGDFGEAERLCRQVLALDPGCGFAVHVRGMAAFAGGRAAEGITLMRRSVEMDHARPGWWFSLGSACEATGRTAEAAEALRAALRLQPYHVEALFRLGRCLREMGLMHEARAAFAQVLRLEPRHGEARAALEAVTPWVSGAA